MFFENKEKLDWWNLQNNVDNYKMGAQEASLGLLYQWMDHAEAAAMCLRASQERCYIWNGLTDYPDIDEESSAENNKKKQNQKPYPLNVSVSVFRGNHFPWPTLLIHQQREPYRQSMNCERIDPWSDIASAQQGTQISRGKKGLLEHYIPPTNGAFSSI